MISLDSPSSSSTSASSGSLISEPCTSPTSMDPSNPLDNECIMQLFLQERLKVKGHSWSPECPVQGPASPKEVADQAVLNMHLQTLAASLMNQSGSYITDITERMGSFYQGDDQVISPAGDVVDGPTRMPLRASPSTTSSDLSSPNPNSPNGDPVDYEIFKSVADELFAFGVRWTHIVTLLVFSGELAYNRGVTLNNQSFVDLVHQWLVTYFNETPALSTWIQSQGGWKGLVEYATSNSSEDEQEDETNGGRTGRDRDGDDSTKNGGLMVGLGTALSVALAGMTYLLAKS